MKKKTANQRSVIVVPQDPEHEELGKHQKWGKGKNIRGPRGIKDQLDFLKMLSERTGNPAIYQDARRMLEEDPYGSIDGWDIDVKTSMITINLMVSISGWKIEVPEEMKAKWYAQTLWDQGHLWFVGAVSRDVLRRCLDKLDRNYEGKVQYPIIDSTEPDAFIELVKKGG